MAIEEAKKKPPARKPSAEATGSDEKGRFRLASRIVKVTAVVCSVVVATMLWMAVFGLVFENTALRVVLALLPTFGVPIVVADRVLKKMTSAQRFRFATDAFVLSLTAMATLLVALQPVLKGAYVREGDRYARGGLRTMASMTYFFAGVSAKFPSASTTPAASGSASSSSSGAGAPSGSGE